MRDLDIGTITGKVLTPVDLRETETGLTYVEFDILESHPDGNATQYHVTAWSRNAERAMEVLELGDQVRVEGRIEAFDKRLWLDAHTLTPL